jgi:arabinose-5-phosphate isomerase
LKPSRRIAALSAALRDNPRTRVSASRDPHSTAKGRLIVSEWDKSGHVARKIAATFASTGTPAFFVQPSEAHGDLGMIHHDVRRLALSWSGETAELKNVIDIPAASVSR